MEEERKIEDRERERERGNNKILLFKMNLYIKIFK